MRWPPQQDRVIERFALCLRPCSVVPMFIASRAWGCNWSYGHTVKYWSVQRLMVILGATPFLEIFFPSALLQNPFTICNFVLVCRSQVQLYCWLRLPSHHLVSVALLFGNVVSSLKSTGKKWWKLETRHSWWRWNRLLQELAYCYFLMQILALFGESSSFLRVQLRGGRAGFWFLARDHMLKDLFRTSNR